LGHKRFSLLTSLVVNQLCFTASINNRARISTIENIDTHSYTPHNPVKSLAKSSVGIGTPLYLHTAYRCQRFAGFFMCGLGTPEHSRFGYELGYLHYGGLGKAASAGRFVCSGSTNLVRFTTQRLVPLCGDLTKSYMRRPLWLI
jgi:hypothetical protein